MHRVSIPYGTIKSIFMLYRKFGKMVFQFLMVRLKDAVQTHNAEFIGVSIPYGTIKSFPTFSAMTAYECFNSLWYD